MAKLSKKPKLIFFIQKQLKLKNIKKRNRCQKYDLSKNAFYKINFWPIWKDLLQNFNFLPLGKTSMEHKRFLSGIARTT